MILWFYNKSTLCWATPMLKCRGACICIWTECHRFKATSPKYFVVESYDKHLLQKKPHKIWLCLPASLSHIWWRHTPKKKFTSVSQQTTVAETKQTPSSTNFVTSCTFSVCFLKNPHSLCSKSISQDSEQTFMTINILRQSSN